MDILSGKSYDVIYHRYDMDIPNANNLEWHILVIYFLTFGQIFKNVIYVVYPNHKYFRMSYVLDIQITNILECHMYGISKSQIFVPGIFYG